MTKLDMAVLQVVWEKDVIDKEEWEEPTLASIDMVLIDWDRG